METFVVRVWTPPVELRSGPDELRGVVERAGTGTSQPFRNDSELLELLRSSSPQRGNATKTGGKRAK